MNDARARSQRFRVALFVIATVGVLLTVVFLLGRSENLFRKKVMLHANFPNTSGLITGAGVRLAGVDIGIVHAIRFDPNPHQKMVDVDLSIDETYLERIRTDSVAQITSKGLLGDMIIDITIGSADKPQLSDGSHIDSAVSPGLSQVVDSVQTAITQVNTLAGDVDTHLHDLLTPQVSTDLGRITHSLADEVETIEHGKGLVHALLYDQALTNQTEDIVGEVHELAIHLNGSLAQVEQILGDVKTGDGLLHAVIYDKKGGEAVDKLAHVANDLTAVVDEVKTGHGLIHSLVYEEDRTNLIQNLSAAARIIRRLAEETAEGKGTVGGLLKDPTVYEDLTTILGNLKRNDLLKALIRYTIVKDKLARPGRVEAEPDQAPAPDAPEQAPTPRPAPTPAPTTP